MKLIDTILYIEWAEALSAGIPKGTMDAAKARKSRSWVFVDDPDDNRKVLIGYDQLSQANKDMIIKAFGDPYKFVAMQPVRKLIKYDAKAEAFFLDYSYGENKKLSREHVDKYTTAANVLNMLREATTDKKELKKLLKLSIDDFYLTVIEIIKQDDIDLPSNYRKLLARRKEYDAEGYVSLISAKFGNKNSAKVSDEVSEAALLELIAHPNQYDDVFICYSYNKWAKEKGYKTITPATVGLHRRTKMAQVVEEREGRDSLNNYVLTNVRGQRPSMPLLLSEVDDNVLDLLYNNPDNPKGEYRYVCMFVKDSFNDYVTGYAYDIRGTLDKGQTNMLIKAAWINSMYYIRSITGAWYLPHEIKSDRWGMKTLRPFYESIAHYTVGEFGGKNNRYIEGSFGSAHHKRALKLGSNNYSGNNISAKNRGVNQDFVKANKNERPMIGPEAHRQIEERIHLMRHMPQLTRKAEAKPSKHEEWIMAWDNAPVERKIRINDEQFLHKFGIEHMPKNGSLPRLTNRGLDVQINKQRYAFVIEGGTPIDFLGKQVTVLYDPFDMSRVLITDHEQVRMIGREPRLSPRAVSDGHTNSRTYLNAILEEKKEQVSMLGERKEKRKALVHAAGFDADTMLQAGVMVKELRQEAETKWLSQSLGEVATEVNEDDYLNEI
jgi:hypothetical protein